MKEFLGLLWVGVFGCGSCLAQLPPRTPSVNDTVQSVKVGADNRVTFSIYATNATSVTVGGDFLQGAPAAHLSKGTMLACVVGGASCAIFGTMAQHRANPGFLPSTWIANFQKLVCSRGSGQNVAGEGSWKYGG